ncbi:DUF2690 domain-containing protein [Luethyella okanaganae]|uniref:DUF2690 domain-containing protein n=1 Tax=Luethyella okanaganae TaxID=69372 RepID=A0ABW1VF61_9MICO
MKKFTKRGVVAGAATLLAIAGSLVAGAAPAQAYTGTDPLASGCAADAYTVASWGMYNSKYGEYQGTAELRASPSCGTNWVRVTSTVPGNRVYAAIQVVEGGYGGDSAAAAAFDVSTSWTRMVYAPGHTCVNVYGRIVDNASNAIEGELPTQTVC